MKEVSIEEKVDLLISGMKIPRKRTRRRVATMTGSILLSIALIAGASLIGFYVKMDGEVTVEHLLTIDGQPAVETPIVKTLNVIPGCTNISETHIIILNPKYDAEPPQFTVYFHIDVTENGEVTNGDELTVKIYNGEGETNQIILSPGVPTNFTIHVTADKAINSTSTYGYIITMDWNQPA